MSKKKRENLISSSGLEQPSPGAPAPAFALPLAGGGTAALAGYRGSKLALFFFPRANTEGCTLEAKAFSEAMPAFEKAGTQVLGVSADTLAALERFRVKQGLTVALASDAAHRTCEAYGVWAEKVMFGHRSMGIVRTSFLIDAQGHVAYLWPKVKVAGHVAQVLEAARAL